MTESNLRNIIEEANNIFHDVEDNNASPVEIARLLSIDSAIVDTLCPPTDEYNNERLPKHLRSVLNFFENGARMTAADPVNMAAAIYFSILDIENHYSQFSNDSIESLGYHLHIFSGHNPMLDEIREKDGLQFIADNTHDKDGVRHFTGIRGFKEDYIFEFEIAERTRISDREYPIHADMFVSIRKRNDAPLVTLSARYDFKKSIGIHALRGYMQNSIPSILNGHTIQRSEIDGLLASYSPTDTSLKLLRYAPTTP